MTTQFAPVCPLPIARQLAKADPEAFGNYHLLIASEILKDPLGYHKFWSERNDHIIVDNGVIEEGAAVDILLLAAAAMLVNANVVVVPDVVADCDATVELAVRKSMPLRRLLPIDTQLMGVVQATTIPEAFVCNYKFDSALIDWVAIPKGYRERNVGKRAEIARDLMAHHILGFSNTDDIEDDLEAARIAGGIDAATPIWMGAVGMTMEQMSPEVPRPPDYWSWQELPLPQLDRALFNIRMVRSWLNEEIRQTL